MTDSELPPSRTPQEKFVLLFEAVKRSLLAVDVLYANLLRDLTSLEELIRRGQDVKILAISPLLSAVSLIDFAHRYGQLIDALPLVKKRSAELERLRQVMVGVEDARHYLQHMRNDLSSNSEIRYPLLGSLSWAHGTECFTLLLSQPTAAEAVSIAIDTHAARWASSCQYSIGPSVVDLQKLVEEMHLAFDWVSTKSPDPSLAPLEWGNSVAFRMSFDPGIFSVTTLGPDKPSAG